MSNRILSSLLVVILGVTFSCTETSPGSETSESQKSGKAKNIILLIGDGMGLSQVSSAFYFKESTPHFKRFPTVGLIRTSSTIKITDSAAGATAFSTGKKSYNGAIGVDADTVSQTTILEIASDLGWNSGVIATSSITHATPASFFAHVKSRGMAEAIAAQLVTSDVDFFAGGGLQYFNGSQDGINTIEELSKADFDINTTSLAVESLQGTRKYGFLLAEDGMPRMLDDRGDFLPNATQMALDYFSLSDSPFFIMVEGSQIDWGGHANNEDYLVSELIDFDNAIGKALDFAEKDGNTLVVVTADHETGGYTLSANDGNYDDIKGTFSTGGHSTTLIPVFAYGPGSELFGGIYENTGIFDKMMEAAGIRSAQ